MKNKKRFVYSTDPDFKPEEAEEELDTPPAGEQDLKVYQDKKHRSGKTATIVRGFVGKESDLNDLGKHLKILCGVGGSVKEGEIIIQGEKRDRVMEILSEKGYKVKRVGG